VNPEVKTSLKTDILCLVHNNLPVTEGFVNALFQNTDKSKFTLVFIDNGSTDSVKKYLQDGYEKSQWKLLRSDTNLGVIGGRNLAVKHVESDYFLNIDNDQYPQSGWLDALHNKMNEGFDIVGQEAWQLCPPSTPGKVIINNREYDRTYYPIKRCINTADKFTYVGCGGMLIKKKVYDAIGLFDERFNPAYFEDPDLNFRALQNNFKIGWCPECNIKHLAHQTMDNQRTFNKSAQFVKSWINFREKWFPYFPS